MGDSSALWNVISKRKRGLRKRNFSGEVADLTRMLQEKKMIPSIEKRIILLKNWFIYFNLLLSAGKVVISALPQESTLTPNNIILKYRREK